MKTFQIKNKLVVAVLWLLTVSAQAQVWQYVDPRIGSVGVGRTFPGPCMPFGMAKPGPDCGVLPNAGWAPMPAPVLGFSQTHVSGTGGGQKYGNILLQPFIDSPSVFNTSLGWPAIPQNRISEDIALGYYATTYENGIRTEITTAERCSFYRFHYPEAGRLLVDVTHFLGKDTIPDLRERQQFVDSRFEVIGSHEVRGYTSVRGGWNNGDAYMVFFTLLSDVPFTAEDNSLCFTDTLVSVKVGISSVSTDQAHRNIPAHDFATQLTVLRNTWEQQLSKIQITGTDEQRRMFYTALYHTMLMPVDKTGEYPSGMENKEAETSPLWGRMEGAPYYDDYYAIWDTYRTSSPLLTLLCPDRQTDIVNSLLFVYAREGYMPDARSGDSNGRTQGGSNAEVVIADAYAKGLSGIDYSFALEAMLKDATVDPGADHEKHGRGGLTEYNRLGHIPYGIDRAGNRTVEYAFCDWCIAQVAQGLGRHDLYQEYMAKSRNWQNLWRSDYEWDGMRGFILPKDADGRWLDSVPWGRSKVFHPTIPYTPVTKVAPWYLPWWSTFFYEATSEEYSLSIPQDVPGLIRVCGGKKQFRRRLDLFFEKGYYNVQNEPSFLTPCLYHWIGRPDLSTQRIHQIIHDNYTDHPDGLPGNDDSGAMSSWLAFHMMGLYPNAGTNYYLLSLPLLPEYTFRLSNGRQLHVTVQGEGDTFKSVSFNGKRLKDARITHQQLMQGGELTFNKRRTPSPLQTLPQPLPIKEGSNYTSHPQTQAVGHSAPSLIGRAGGESVGGESGESFLLLFTLNRQFRTWPISLAWDADTLLLTCKQTTYCIPRSEVEHAKRFCWLSPQVDGTIHHNATGTFCFISFDALRTLQQTGSFVYDNITWRLIAKDETTLHVRADIDGTEMLIAVPPPYGGDWGLQSSHRRGCGPTKGSESPFATEGRLGRGSFSLPLVLEMRQNPLGIDWIYQPANP